MRSNIRVLRQGRLKIVRRLGEGGMGAVYEATDTVSHGAVAIKQLKVDYAEGLQRFKDEFRALQDLDHPNLIQIGELFEEEGQWFFTMELLSGQDFVKYVRSDSPPANAHADDPIDDTLPNLASNPGVFAVSGVVPIIQRPPSLNEPRLRVALRQLVEAVDFLHRAGKVHRDIKPSNILVTAEERVVLLDFGIVTSIEGDNRTITQSRAILGTVEYMAPEQAAGQGVGPEADWYAVGCVLYEALTGSVPFTGSPIEILLRKQRHMPPRPTEIQPGLPSDLDDLCMQLMQPKPQDRLSAAQILHLVQGVGGAPVAASSPATQPSGAQVFVGRDAELAELMRAFNHVKSNRSAVAVVVEGESGVGKSALVRRFSERIRAADSSVIVLSGRCYQRETVPYKAVDGVMDSLARYLARLSGNQVRALLPRRAWLLAETFPVLRRLAAVGADVSPPVAKVVHPQEQRSRLFEAMRELSSRIAERYPLVLMIDDLQWADADSLSLLAELMRPPDEPSLLLVATMRHVTPGAAPGAGQRSMLAAPDLRMVCLGRLGLEDSQRLVAALLHAQGPRPSVDLDTIVREADGHPLFIHELATHTSGPGEAAPAAMSLDDVLRLRMDALSSEARRVLELVVVAGTPVRPTTLASAAKCEPAEFFRALCSLRAGRFVQPYKTTDEDAIGPYHDRVREALLGALDDAKIREHHLALAEALEASELETPERLAHHWACAGQDARAVVHAIKAAEAAQAALAFDHAADFYRSALETSIKLGDPTRELCVHLGDALAQAGRGAEAAAVYLQAAQESSEQTAVLLRRRATEQFFRSGRIDQGMTILRRVLDAVGLGFPQTPLGALCFVVFYRLVIRLRGLGFRERQEKELDAQTLGRIDICWLGSMGLSHVDTIRGAEFNARGLLFALRAGEPFRLVLTLATEAVHASYRGRRNAAKADAIFDVASGLAQRLNRSDANIWVTGTRGIAQYLRGQWKASYENLIQAEAAIIETGTAAFWELQAIRSYIVIVSYMLGRMDEFARRVPRYLTEAVDRGDLYGAVNQRLGLANSAWLVVERTDDAQRMIDDAAGHLSRSGFHIQHWYHILAQAHVNLYMQRGQEAHECFEKGWEKLGNSLLLRLQTIRVFAPQLRARCALAAAELEGQANGRAKLLGIASKMAHKIAKEDASYAAPMAALIRAGVAFGHERTDQARELLTSAAEGFDACDMALYAAAARSRLGEILGGESGIRALQDGRGWMTQQGMRNPPRWTAIVAPGFGPRR